ncbi:MAG: ABC transporter permease [Bacteroidales bacterium]
MKLLAVIRKSLLEQVRQFWILLLTLLMAPFFVGVFYLIYESTEITIQIAVVNEDGQLATNPHNLNQGQQLINYLKTIENDTLPVRFLEAGSRQEAAEMVRLRQADGMLVIPAGFSDSIHDRLTGQLVQVPFEISGNLAETNYLLAAILGITYASGFINQATGTIEAYRYTETAAGSSSGLTDFTLGIPGLLVLATIMLMFSGAIAFVAEPEKRTMLRLKLSKLKPATFLSGVTLVQILVGLVSILLTLLTANLLGFRFSGSFWLFLLVSILTSLSIIGFSLILAALTRSANEILIAGNFPLFLFMFFSGTIFPVHGPTLLTISGYDLTIPGLMSTYHGVDALKQILIFNSGVGQIWPQLICLTGLTLIYFLIGYLLYEKNHMTIR